MCVCLYVCICERERCKNVLSVSECERRLCAPVERESVCVCVHVYVSVCVCVCVCVCMWIGLALS
jgi:hypothetical protein